MPAPGFGSPEAAKGLSGAFCKKSKPCQREDLRKKSSEIFYQLIAKFAVSMLESIETTRVRQV
jgi:hypothetical protein